MKLDLAMAKLTRAQRARLEWNFEAGIADFVKVADGVYVGVHVEQLEHLEVIEAQGAWATAKKRPREAT